MKTFLRVMFLLSISSATQAQVSRGTVQEGVTMDSKVLRTKVRYSVYLPFDYESSRRFYPVVYLLHGYTDNDMAWIQFGEAHLTADEGIATGKIPPMIIVMPDGGTSWFINNHNDSLRYEEFFFKEFVPFIESRYRIRAEKPYRAVAGLSMGGFGTLVYALHHPEMFGSCAALSAAVNTADQLIAMEDRAWNSSWPAKIYGPQSGPARRTEHLLSNNPIHLVQTGDPVKLKSVRMYIDCGDDDYLTVGNALLHVALNEKGIPHEYRVRDGAHTWGYWRSGLFDALEFIGRSFHKP